MLHSSIVLVPFPGGVKLSGWALVVLVASGALNVASCMTPKVRCRLRKGSPRPWDWLPCEWLRPFTKEATSKTRRARSWDWLPCEWMSPFTKEATSKTRPHYVPSAP